MGYSIEKCTKLYQDGIKELLEVINIQLSEESLKDFSNKLYKVILLFEMLKKERFEKFKFQLEDVITPEVWEKIWNKHKEKENDQRD